MMTWKQLFGVIALVVAVWLLPSFLWGEKPPQKLSLDEAIREALANNPKLKAMEGKFLETQALITGSRLWSNPELETELTRSDENHLSFHLSKEITLGGRHKRRTAQIELRKDEMELESAKKEIVADVKSSFFSLLYWQERMPLAEQDLQTAKEQEHIAQVRFNIGDIPETELSSAHIQVEKRKKEKEEIAKELKLARISLNSLLGRPVETEFVAEGKLDIPKLNGDIERLIKSAEQHPSIKAMELERERILKEFSLAKARRFPPLTLSLIYERDVRENLFGGSVGFPLPMFDRNQGEIMDAIAREKVLSAEIKGQKLDVSDRVWSALTLLNSAQRSMELTGSAVALAEKNLKLAKRGYELGEKGMADVIEAQDKLLELKKTYLETLFDYNEAFITIERYSSLK